MVHCWDARERNWVYCSTAYNWHTCFPGTQPRGACAVGMAIGGGALAVGRFDCEAPATRLWGNGRTTARPRAQVALLRGPRLHDPREPATARHCHTHAHRRARHSHSHGWYVDGAFFLWMPHRRAGGKTGSSGGHRGRPAPVTGGCYAEGHCIAAWGCMSPPAR